MCHPIDLPIARPVLLNSTIFICFLLKLFGSRQGHAPHLHPQQRSRGSCTSPSQLCPRDIRRCPRQLAFPPPQCRARAPVPAQAFGLHELVIIRGDAALVFSHSTWMYRSFPFELTVGKSVIKLPSGSKTPAVDVQISMKEGRRSGIYNQLVIFSLFRLDLIFSGAQYCCIFRAQRAAVSGAEQDSLRVDFVTSEPASF